MALRFGLSLAQKAGCNHLPVNSDNMQVIEVMKNGGHSAGAAAVVLDDCYFISCDFCLLDLNILMGKQIRWLMKLPG